ncbi:hypothetical protein [Winogradskyella undariae]|uniref:hypothetical protein n=1 Tax=Winogradskyella undariae TaxID=1285465 RepID=UPI0015CEC81B|nr:hypothetical protein [Winogradskyella undariae]
MKIRFIILCLSCILVINCDDDTKQNTGVETTSTTDQDAKITAKTIENIQYKDFVLSNEAEDAIVTWEKYHELATQLSYLKRGDFSFFNGDIELLKKFIKEYNAQIPEVFSTNPILSRNTIIETELLKLNESLTLDNIERSEKIENIKSLFIAFSNLNDMMNKKLERDIYSKIVPE